MSNQDPHQVRSSQPINLRTARKQGLQRQTQLNAAEQQRVAALMQRHQTAVSGSAPAKQKTMSKAMLVAVATLLTSGGALGMAVIVGSGALALLASTGVGLSGFLFARASNRRQSDQAEAFAIPQQQLQTIDDLIAKVQEESDEEVQTCLQQIRQQLDRVMQMLEDAGAVESLSLEQRFYVQQFVERYLPDSLRAYLKVPVHARNEQAILEEKTALMLLKSQLSLLQQGLSEQEIYLQENAAEHLVQQQRFLESKKDDHVNMQNIG